MELQAIIDDVETGIGSKTLGHGSKPRAARFAIADRAGGTPHHEPRRFEFGGVVGDTKAQGLKISEALTKLLARPHVLERAVEAELRTADRAGRDIEPPAVEPAHGDAKAISLGADAICNRHPAAIEHDHCGRLRLPAELLLLCPE